VVGATEVDIFADDLLEEDATRERPVEHLSEGKFALQHADVIEKTGGSVLAWKGMR
jgi:hypothetical protein